MEISFDLRTDRNEKADAMRRILETRSKELGYTTGQSCRALVINVLKPLRADTRVANENAPSKITVVESDSRYFPSW